MPTIQLNGEKTHYDHPVTLDGLVKSLTLSSRAFALAKNGEIIPQSQFTSIEINEGDQIELIHPVGGG